MGQGHGRQQSPGSIAGPGSSSLLGPQTMGGPMPGGGPLPQEGATSVAAGGDCGQDDCIPVVFTWTHGGQNVFLAASFNGWREQIPMVRSGNEFSVVQDLPRGVHQYKFIVDDHWRFAPDQPKTQDSQGNMNNIMDISGYHRFQPQADEKEMLPKFGQHIPDPNDYTLDAPAVPMALHKSPFCAVPPRPQSGPPLSIPIHSLSDHIYFHERDESFPTTVAVTHRYGQKYSTIVFATWSGDDRELHSRPNFLKAAVLGSSSEPS